MKTIISILESIPGLIVLFFLLFCAYAISVWFPVYLYSEAQCLKKGYPKTYVSVSLGRYCANLNGSVTVKVDEL